MATSINYGDVKGLDSKSIDSQVSEIRRELFDLKMQFAVSGAEKPHRIKVLKKNIAKLLTAKNQKQVLE